jgi:hypothetical protein
MLRDLFGGGLASKEWNARHEKEWFFLEGVIFFLEGVIPSKKNWELQKEPQHCRLSTVVVIYGVKPTFF